MPKIHEWFSYLLIFKILIILHNMLTISVSYACIAYTILSTWKLTFCPIQALDPWFQTPQCVSAGPTRSIYPGTSAGLAARFKCVTLNLTFYLGIWSRLPCLLQVLGYLFIFSIQFNSNYTKITRLKQTVPWNSLYQTATNLALFSIGPSRRYWNPHVSHIDYDLWTIVDGAAVTVTLIAYSLKVFFCCCSVFAP